VATNHGPGDATGVVILDRMPSSSSYVSATPSAGSCTQAGGKVTCNVGNVANGAMVTVDIVVKSHGNPNTIYDTGSVSANEADPDMTNNQDVESTRLVGFRRFRFAPGIVTGGCGNSVGTLLFTSPAPAGVQIDFADNSTAIDPIAPVTTTGGELSIQVTAVTSMVNATQIATITASTTSGPNSIQARLKLLPVTLTGLSLSPNPAQGGQHVTGTVTLACAANQDVVVRLTSNRGAARPDVNMVTIPAGQTSAMFGITTHAVPSARDVIITAMNHHSSRRATLHLTP
jgi:uncharacterized protein DUF11